MKVQTGYIYHIKDDFFDKINDKGLMINHENGKARPTYFTIKDKDILWFIPLSSWKAHEGYLCGRRKQDLASLPWKPRYQETLRWISRWNRRRKGSSPAAHQIPQQISFSCGIIKVLPLRKHLFLPENSIFSLCSQHWLITK